MFLERGVQVGDVCLVVLPVMNLHRLRVDVRLERGEVVRELWKFVRHASSSSIGRKEESYLKVGRYLIDNMRSRATFVQYFCSSGTTMRLWTRPSTSSSRIQSRWFGDTRNIVEQRQPNRSSDTTVRSGATSCARRLTRCTSVPTAQTDPTGLFFTVLMMYSVLPLSSAACTTSHGTSGWTITRTPGCCVRTLAICAALKRTWTEQCPFHRIMRARFSASGSTPPKISCGSHTTISSSGMPILYAVFRPRC